MTDAAIQAHERRSQLSATADGQLAELIGLLSSRGEDALSLPCPGREKMGDGTVAACASHTADRYQRIAEFLWTAGQMKGASAPTVKGDHRMPRFPRPRGYGPSGYAESAYQHDTHDDGHTTQNVDLDSLLQRLTAGREALDALAELTDEQLDSVPPAGSFRFCDGQRTLEQVVAALLKHQGHQIDAVKAALA
jgi:hypothetical protein